MLNEETNSKAYNDALDARDQFETRGKDYYSSLSDQQLDDALVNLDFAIGIEDNYSSKRRFKGVRDALNVVKKHREQKKSKSQYTPTDFSFWQPLQRLFSSSLRNMTSSHSSKTQDLKSHEPGQESEYDLGSQQFQPLKNVEQFMDRPNPRFPRSNLEAKESKGLGLSQSQSQSHKKSKEETTQYTKKKVKMM